MGILYEIFTKRAYFIVLEIVNLTLKKKFAMEAQLYILETGSCCLITFRRRRRSATTQHNRCFLSSLFFRPAISIVPPSPVES
jgi:hypothetical protein